MDALDDDTIKREQSEPGVLFGTVYRNFAGTVRGYLQARGVDDPESVTQDVFLALYPQLPRLQGGVAGLKTLLFSIAHSRVVDHHRSRARIPMITEYDAELDSRVVDSAEDEVLKGLGDHGVLGLLAGLADDQREVLGLRVVADLSLEQTATIMGRSPGAIKQLQLRALTNLRNKMDVGGQS
jgi:RNA polymerase sigma-70 factor (ECF subfamily)